MHLFKITYHEGFPCIENSYFDYDLVVNNLKHYHVKIFTVYEKQKIGLKHRDNNFGATIVLENYTENVSKHLLTEFDANFNTWHKPYYYRFLIPYHIEISYDGKLLLSDSFDLRNKLVLFNLDSDNINDLHVWMNAIGIFKKKMNCDIAIKNNLITEISDYDYIADIKYKNNENSVAHYYMLNIGRYYLPNSDIANPYYHPDGLKNKNALEIINDILYYSSSVYIN